MNNSRKSQSFKLRKIISGGQTGADRAGLDAAVALGIEYGGALPRGRKTEDGPLSTKYTGMTELPTGNYASRTVQNVKAADATLVFMDGKAGAGTALTVRICNSLAKPFLIIDFKAAGADPADRILDWLNSVRPSILNIAGSRESLSPGTYKQTLKLLKTVLKK